MALALVGRLASGFRVFGRLLRLRPPILAGGVVAAALIGLVVWLELASGEAPGDGAPSVTVPIAHDGSAPHDAPKDSASHGETTAHDAGTKEPADAPGHGADGEAGHEAGHGQAESSASATAHGDGGAEPTEAGPGSTETGFGHETPSNETAVHNGGHAGAADAGHGASDRAAGESHVAADGGAGQSQDEHGEGAAHAEPIVLAPVDPELLQTSSRGGLPIVGPDGRKPWQVYARPGSHEKERPRVAIVIGGLGLNRAMTEAAIKLPPEITLSFSPYAGELGALIGEARAAGHEVMIDLPLEPISYPADDPGPDTLLTSLTPPQNIERLELVMARANAYVGFLGVMGSRFTTAPDSLRPVLSVLSERGLLFVDDRSSAESLVSDVASQLKLPHAVSRGFIDMEATRSAIDAALARLEREAKPDRPLLAIARPFPVTLQRIEAWSKTLADREIVLEPVSAIVTKAKKGERDQPVEDLHGAKDEAHGEAPASSDSKSNAAPKPKADSAGHDATDSHH
ncbi:MAG: divergent polysaccharide deacetylase family protein [Alphaproteobacteria bacterium]|nr:divergent polysaccharide deacetylase family protein [Alphaproteobacteria bacterium]